MDFLSCLIISTKNNDVGSQSPFLYKYVYQYRPFFIVLNKPRGKYIEHMECQKQMSLSIFRKGIVRFSNIIFEFKTYRKKVTGPSIFLKISPSSKTKYIYIL